MNRTLIRELKDNTWKEVMLKWWMHDFRNLGKIAFLILRDRSGLCQIILEDPFEISKLDWLYTGTTLIVNGTPMLESNNKRFWLEVKNATLKVIHPVKYVFDTDISKPELALDLDGILENRVVTLRHPKQSAIFKLASIVEKHIRNFFDTQDFTQINSPKLIWFPTEWWAEIFELDYFEKKAYLAQSPQFYKQIMSAIYERVYEIGRAYRAEKSNTSRHMSEILMLDMEMWFIDSFDDVLDMTEKFLKYIIEHSREEWKEYFQLRWAEKPIISEKIPRITMKELHQLYSDDTWENTKEELDLTPAEEKWICEYAEKNWWSQVVFVTWFPRSDAKFYHFQSPDDPSVADRADLLFRWVEIATVTRREVRYDVLVDQVTKQGIDPTNPWLKYYLDAFKYGMSDTGGFGFGIARFIQKLLGLQNAKEADLFPRDRNRLTP